MVAFILALTLLLSTAAASAEQIHATNLDGYAVPCTGLWHAWPIVGSPQEIHGGTIVMDSSGGFTDAALYLLTDQPAGDHVAVAIDAHAQGPGRFTFRSHIPAGTHLATNGTYYLGGVCEPGQRLSLYTVIYWTPRR